MRAPFLIALTLALTLCLSLAGCGAEQPMREGKGGPALWRIEKDGRSAYIFGTIHVLPRGVVWQTPALRSAMAASDRLVLEATGLNDSAGIQSLFAAMGQSPNLPPIDARVPVAQRPALRSLIVRGHMSAVALSAYESWAAALLLSTVAQADMHLSGGEGVEPVLTATFTDAGKPIAGLETIARQFALFDHMPEAVQRRFLAQTVAQAKNARVQYEAMLRAWLNGDMQAIARDFIGELAQAPDLIGPLLTDRNRMWADKIVTMRGKPFIAVGAAHLAGPDNLIALLTARGYRVMRVQ